MVLNFCMKVPCGHSTSHAKNRRTVLEIAPIATAWQQEWDRASGILWRHWWRPEWRHGAWRHGAWRHTRRHSDVQYDGHGILSMPNFEFLNRIIIKEETAIFVMKPYVCLNWSNFLTYHIPCDSYPTQLTRAPCEGQGPSISIWSRGWLLIHVLVLNGLGGGLKLPYAIIQSLYSL